MSNEQEQYNRGLIVDGVFCANCKRITTLEQFENQMQYGCFYVYTKALLTRQKSDITKPTDSILAKKLSEDENWILEFTDNTFMRSYTVNGSEVVVHYRPYIIKYTFSNIVIIADQISGMEYIKIHVKTIMNEFYNQYVLNKDYIVFSVLPAALKKEDLINFCKCYNFE